MRNVIVGVVLLVVGAACGDTSSDPIVFGEGDIPPAIPADFPVPDSAVIGPTLIDNVNTKSEFEFRVGLDLEVLVQFVSVGLVEAGYVVRDSSGDVVMWTIDFTRGSLEGGVVMRSLGPGAAQGVVTVNDT